MKVRLTFFYLWELAEARRRKEERLHDNQPEWTKVMRGVQPEMMARQELEAPVDRRCWRDERQCNNQPDKRHKRGAMRGGSTMRGGGTGGHEAPL